MKTIYDVSAGNAPMIERLKLPLVKRSLTVADKFNITPNMIRIVLTGEELHGFQSPSADDNIKIMTESPAGETAMRSYTPRRYDADRNELVLDFAVHEAGPATQWALDVQIGEAALIGGPRGSKRVVGNIDHWLLIGDETALPAMLRRVEEGGPDDHFTLLASIPTLADQQEIKTVSSYRPIWLPRDGASPADPALLRNALDEMVLPDGCFVWLAAEGSVTRTIRQYLNEARGVPLNWIKATGYWVAGQAGTTAKFEA